MRTKQMWQAAITLLKHINAYVLKVHKKDDNNLVLPSQESVIELYKRKTHMHGKLVRSVFKPALPTMLLDDVCHILNSMAMSKRTFG